MFTEWRTRQAENSIPPKLRLRGGGGGIKIWLDSPLTNDGKLLKYTLAVWKPF